MNRNLLLLCFFFASVQQALSQLKPDSFVFRDDIDIDYNLSVRNNDTDKDSLKIVNVVKLGSNASKYTLTISSDSFLVQIFSADNSLDSSTFYYVTKHKNGSLDSTFVFFERKAVATTIYPGDCNKDNLVNHLDVFPIGIFYGKTGYPRNNSDTSIVFQPRKSQNWFFQTGGINASHADVDGNGIVDISDATKYQSNFGNAKGNYSPNLSGNSSTVQLKLSISDTIDLTSSTGKIQIPVLIVSPTIVNAYGIGYSYTIRVLNKSKAPFDSFYPHTKYLESTIWPDKLDLFVKDTISFREHVNVAKVRRNQANGDMDPQAGVIEVVTDEVLLGIANQKDLTYINILLKEVSLVDKELNTIPLTPISKRIYFRKAASSIQSIVNEKIMVYPTLIDDFYSIEKLSTKKISYTIFNSFGQVIESGVLNSNLNYLSANSWPTGVYYLKIDNNSEVVKLQKQ